MSRMTTWSSMTLVAVTAAASVAAVVFATAASATYPGVANGRLAFGTTLDGNTDVYSVRPSGAAWHRLTDQAGFDACPAYSSDGQWIAWCSFESPSGTGTGGIWVMRQNGTEKQQVTSPFGAFPDFSPNDEKIAFLGAPPGSTNVDIWVVDRDGSNLTRLTSAAGQDQFPAWSPDGSKIVFESTRTGVKQVWVMNSDGTDQTQLTFDPTPKDQVPDWSPDGSQIAYVERTNPTGGDLWLMNADGSGQHAITSGADKLGTAWSPDGAQIATLDWPTRTVEIMNADGSGLQRVHPGGIQFVPGWQPRGAGDVGEND